MGIDEEPGMSVTAEPRRQGKRRLRGPSHPPGTKITPQGRDHELELHQMELEMQNIELIRTQGALEAQQIELELQNEELVRVQEELEISRNKYSELYDLAPVGYFTFDPVGQILEVNLAGTSLLGIERLQLVDRFFSDFIVDATGWEVFLQHLVTTRLNLGIHRCELRLKGHNGCIIHAQFQSVTVAASKHENVAIFSSIIDGTIAKQLETEIQDAREYAENIVETVHKPLVVLDSDLRIISANNNFYETFNVTPEVTIDKFIYDLGNRQWDIPRLRALFENILPNDTFFNGYEVDHDFPGVGRKIILLNARQIFRKNISSHIILLAMEDITARKQVEAERTLLDQAFQEKNIELERAKLMAEKANQAKSEFLSSMSHELRTPLGAILGFAQLMETGMPQPTPAQKRSIKQILKAGWYLLELINEILDLALIESGKLMLSLEPVYLAEVLRECEAMIEVQARKHSISVLFTDLEFPYLINADQTRTKQVIINLLSNAIKYNRVGGKVTVICTPCHPNSIRISVEDTGYGLVPEHLAQLFQPFNRLGQKANLIEGTGIGLVVSKRLVELMGGVIGVESTVGKGSLFWVDLKLSTESQVKIYTEVLTTSAEVLVQGSALKYSMLYVEDNPANLMLVEDLVTRRPDIRMLSARDGIRGVEIARSFQPDIILMDINLPGISGLEALKILREDPTTTHIPIIALSANAVPSDIEKGLVAGFFRYLTKPIKVIEFMDTLDVALKFAQSEAVKRS